MEIKKIEDSKIWESALETFDYSTIFLSWEWRSFEKSQGYDYENFIMYDGESPIAMWGQKFINAKRGKYLHLRHSPLINWQNKESVKLWIDKIKEDANKKGAHFIRISPLIPDSETNRELLKSFHFVPSTAHASDAELTVALDLTKSEDELLAEMRKNTRYSIRKAEKEGVTVDHIDGLKFFDDFMKIYKDTVSRQGWKAYSEKYIKSEYEIFSKNKKAEMFISYYQGKPISASIFTLHRDQVIYHHSGSLTEYRNIPSTYLLHWEAIKHFKALGYKLYNFWGVCEEDQQSHPWYGLSLFKRGFTKNELRFIHAHDLILNPMAHLTRAYEWIEKKSRGY